MRQEDFLKAPEDFGKNDQEEVLKFRVSLICFNLEMGSRESLKMLRSIIVCENNEVLVTGLIKALLHHKWSKVLQIMRLLAFIYFIFLIILSSYALFGHYDSLLGFLLLSNSGFAILNALQVVGQRMKFVNDF